MAEKSTDSAQETNPPRDGEALDPRRIDALIRLLGDDDVKIRSVAWNHLVESGEAVLPLIEVAERESTDPKVRVQARRYRTESQRRQALATWVEFCRSERLDLETGSLLIAQSEYPDLEPTALSTQLDRYADGLRHRLQHLRTVGEAVQKIGRFLFREEGFQGNSQDYYNPDNSYLNRVLERRQGIPITLAVVFLLLGRRLSVQLRGVNMPRHFLLKYRDPGGDAFVDCFHDGAILSPRDCVAFLKESGLPFREDYLRGIPDRSVLRRMLGNLLRIYIDQNDQRRTGRIAAMLKLLE